METFKEVITVREETTLKEETTFKDATKCITIMGLGLIGGSIAKSLRQKGFPGKIIGYDISDEALELGLASKVIDEGYLTVGPWITQSDLIVIATTFGNTRKVIDEIKPYAKGALITDVGSVKNEASLNIDQLEGFRFVGGHPLAGSEKSGMLHSKGDLFNGKNYYVIPYDSSEKDVASIFAFVEFIGAVPVLIEASKHDELMAFTSHVPHILAASLVNLASNGVDHDSEDGHYGTGFIDTTRIASGSPGLWTDIIIGNKEEILKTMDQMIKLMDDVRQIVKDEQRQELTGFLSNAKDTRDELSKPVGKALEYSYDSGNFLLNFCKPYDID